MEWCMCYVPVKPRSHVQMNSHQHLYFIWDIDYPCRYIYTNSDVTGALKSLKSPTTLLLVQHLVQADNKNWKLCKACHLLGKSTGDRFPVQRASKTESVSMSGSRHHVTSDHRLPMDRIMTRFYFNFSRRSRNPVDWVTAWRRWTMRWNEQITCCTRWFPSRWPSACAKENLPWTPARWGEDMGLWPDTLNCGLRMHGECQERFPRHRGLAIPTCVTARAWRTCRDACRVR